MNPILIFRHIECEGPGYLADFLHARGIRFRLVCLDRGESVPVSLAGIGGLVFMGGPMSVHDPLPWINAELELIRHAHQKDIPVLGHCLGGQLISKALGGRITANPVREIGWFPVTGHSAAAAVRWLDGLPAEFCAFHMHGERFTLPKGTVPLLTSRFCSLQAFVKGNTLAIQCHMEVTAAMIEEWLQVYHKELGQPSESVQTMAEIRHDLDRRVADLHQIAEKIYARWIDNR
ncbi:MAG: hypothetical protein A2W28_07595 [Gammaproteobacteria bacterium RBG_16_51_14]|nr:MAG: hypothetical protein A2W28_07595 [Gammaproteobacteria bacterium RBG_16_51_14]